jgi:filamentous hemagglutinin family protein
MNKTRIGSFSEILSAVHCKCRAPTFGCAPTLDRLIKRFGPKVFLKSERKVMQLNRTVMPLGLALLGVTLGTQTIQAQIVPTAVGQPGATNTVATPVGVVTNITGGQTSGTNLFHSFTQFGLANGATADFVTPAGIANVLSRVTGGAASVIDGNIQLSVNAGANLYLMNPSGVIFGPNATLNVPASFAVTTATAIGFQDNVTTNQNYFNAVGNNIYANLTGGPTSLLFPPGANGSIVNLGNLAVPAGANNTLAMFGNTVLQGADLNVSGANVIAASLPNPRVVRLAQPGNLLSLEFPAGQFAGPNVVGAATIASLPALITGGNFGGATNVQVNGGVVTLTGGGGAGAAGTVINAGDLAVRNVNITAAAGGAAGPNAGSVIFLSGGNLVAGNITNSVANGANIALQGNAANGGTLGGGTVRLASGFFQGQGNGGGTLNVGNIQDTANIILEGGGGIVGGSFSTRGVTAGRNDAITLTTRTGNIQVINLLANNTNAAGVAGTGGNIVVNVPAGSFQSSGTLSAAALGGGAGSAGASLTTIAGGGAAGGAASVAARGTININQLGGGAGSSFIQGANLERDVNGNIIYRLASDQTIRVLINGINANGSLILANATTGTLIPGGGNVVVRSVGAAAPAIAGGGGSQGLIIRLNGANTAFNGGLGFNGVAGSTGVTVRSGAGGAGAVATGNPAAGVLPGATAPGAGGTVIGGPAFGGPAAGTPVTPAPGGPGTTPGTTPANGNNGAGGGTTVGGGITGGTTTNGTTGTAAARLRQSAGQAQDQIELGQTGDLSGSTIAATTPSGNVFTGDAAAVSADEGVLTRRITRQVEVPIVEKEKEIPVIEAPKSEKPKLKVTPQLW